MIRSGFIVAKTPLKRNPAGPAAIRKNRAFFSKAQQKNIPAAQKEQPSAGTEAALFPRDPYGSDGQS